eukprot:359747-Chlamydomonas_euryale.AAC.3
MWGMDGASWKDVRMVRMEDMKSRYATHYLRRYQVGRSDSQSQSCRKQTHEGYACVQQDRGDQTAGGRWGAS